MYGICTLCGGNKATLDGECRCAGSKKTALAHQEGGSHYKDLAIQPAEFVHNNRIPYLEGSVIYYVTRWRDKNGVEDLRKARHTLDLLIELEQASVPDRS